MPRLLLIVLLLMAFSLSAFAAQGKSSPILPAPVNKSYVISVENSSDVILWDPSARKADFTLWNLVKGELRPLSFPPRGKTYPIEGAYHSTDGWYLLDGVYLSYISHQGQLEKINLSNWGGYTRLIPLADHSVLVEGKFPNKNSTNGDSYLVRHVWLENGMLTASPPLAIPALSGRSFAIVALADGRVMILGGTNEGYVGCNACVASTFFLDPKTENWTSGPNMLQPRDDETATLLPDGSVLVTGGWTPEHSWQGGPSNTTERWIPAENRFVADAPMPAGKAGHHTLWVVGQRGKQLLILGGDSRDWISNRIVLDYDVATGVWHKAGTTSTGPYGPDGSDISLPYGTTLINGQVFLWGRNLDENFDLWPLTLPAANATAPQGAMRVAAPKGMGSPSGYLNQIDKEYLLGVAAMNPEQLKWLVSQGADVNTRDSQGSTLLMIACKSFDVDTIRSLIDNGADINAKNNDGSTALMLASMNDRIDIVRELLSRNVEVNAQDKNGNTALMLALQYNQLDVMPVLLDKDANVNIAAIDGTTALMLASSKGHLDVVQALLAKGADVNAKMGNGENALMLASQMGQVEVVQALLTSGADVNDHMNDGTNALMLARPNHPDVVQVLLAKGAKANAQYNDHVINIVQLDRYSGTIGKHPVQVALGDTGIEVLGHYHYGRKAKREEDTLVLAGRKNAAGDWELIESNKSEVMNGKAKQSGLWVLSPVAEGWKGSWSNMDGTGNLPVSLRRELEAADYAIASNLNNDPKARSASPACMIRVFRHGQLAETIDASNDMENCGWTDVFFPHLNSDEHADLIYNIDTSGKNVAFESWRYDPMKHRFIDEGTLIHPADIPGL